MKFILASASPRRLELLRQIGIEPAEIIAPTINEAPLKNELPRDYVLRMATEKAATVGLRQPGQLILGADTIVACGRRILGKAEDAITARRFLKLLSGRRHRVYTAICLQLPDGSARTKIVMTHVRFKRLSKTELEAYIASNEWEGKAGGYAIQGRAAAFIPSINGSYSNVVGLPLAETSSLLSSFPLKR